MDAAAVAVADVLAQLNAEAVTWRPVPGERVAGILRTRGTRSSEHSTDYPVLTIAPLDGSPWVVVHAFHSVLWEEITSWGPQVGDAVAIRYDGKMAGGKNGEGYERYTFRSRPVSSFIGGTADLPASTNPPSAPPSRGVTNGDSPGAGARASASAHPGGGVAVAGSPPAADLDGGTRPGVEPDPVAGVAQWSVLLDKCDGSLQIATDRINNANGTAYTRQIARHHATWSELEKALVPLS